jgi:hypothetical protein
MDTPATKDMNKHKKDPGYSDFDNTELNIPGSYTNNVILEDVMILSS